MERVELPQDWETLLAGYVLGDLTPYEVTKVKEYLVNYPELTTQVNKLQTTLGLFSLSLPKNSSSQPSRNLRSRILQAAEAELRQEDKQLREDREHTTGYEENLTENMGQETSYPEQEIQSFSPSSHPWKSKQIWFGLVGTVAAGLIGVLGFNNYRLNRELLLTKSHLSRSQQELELSGQKLKLSQLKQELAATRQDLFRYEQALTLLKEPNNRLLTLKGITSTSDYSGSLIIAPNSQTAVLTLQNLSTLPTEKVYRLWAFVDGKKVKCAKFTPDSEGKVMEQIPLKDWGSTTEVFVTIEPKEGFNMPSGEEVMRGTRAI